MQHKRLKIFQDITSRVALDAPERIFFRFELERGLAYVLRSP